MLTHARWFLATAVLAAASPWAQATSWRFIPDEIAVGTSDLTVVGKITSKDANAVPRHAPTYPPEMKVALPSYNLAVSEVIFDREAWELPAAKRTFAPPAKGDTLRVAIQSAPFDGDDQPKVGGEYAFVLKRMPDGNDWHVSAHPAYRREAKAEVVAALKKAADIDKWNWGKESEGLRLALVMGSILPYRAKEGQAVPVMMAVRNVSRAPVHLNCDPADELLSVRGVAADGNTVAFPLKRRPGSTESAGQKVPKLEPGRMVFITPYGQRNENYTFHLPLPVGKAKLQVIYESKREGTVKESPEHKGGPVIWKGKLASAEVDIDLPKPKN